MNQNEPRRTLPLAEHDAPGEDAAAVLGDALRILRGLDPVDLGADEDLHQRCESLFVRLLMLVYFTPMGNGHAEV